MSVAFQTVMSFLALNVLVFYFEWRLALFLLLNFPLAMVTAATLQLVCDNTYVHVLSVIQTFCIFYTKAPLIIYSHVLDN